MELHHAGSNVLCRLLHERFGRGAGIEGPPLGIEHFGGCEDHQAKKDFTRS
jgi:hypothetical protein